jgi:tRNA-specific 2-thiouridylase
MEYSKIQTHVVKSQRQESIFMKIVVAMSGGVDSSVAAAFLKRDGHDVIGVTMQLSSPNDNVRRAIADARKVAKILGIEHHIIDLQDVFSRTIIADFCREYSRGYTPNPCVICNRDIKFGILWERVKGLGANFLATGHYAQSVKDKNRYLLKKGKDKHKDQSYFLCQLTQEQLSRALFPLGSLTKEKVRQIARKLGLHVTERPESQEICFVTDNDHARFLKDHFSGEIKPGPILDRQGNLMGQHQGVMFYTVGQRKGLGVTAADPLYVTAIEPERNAIIIGTKEETYSSDLVADNLNWISITTLEKPTKVKARIRYRHPEANAIISPLDEKHVQVKFSKPQMAITPGQAVVFYRGDNVIGGGRIIKQGR